MKQQVIDTLSAHGDAIRRQGVLSLSLFGSVARGEERPDSDIDLLAEFEQPPTFDAYMDLKFFLEDLLGRPVDLVSARALKPLARPFVEREAIRVA
jgi:hypothetical protein